MKPAAIGAQAQSLPARQWRERQWPARQARERQSRENLPPVTILRETATARVVAVSEVNEADVMVVRAKGKIEDAVQNVKLHRLMVQAANAVVAMQALAMLGLVITNLANREDAIVADVIAGLVMVVLVIMQTVITQPVKTVLASQSLAMPMFNVRLVLNVKLAPERL